jgi:hypothetical protein
MYSKTTKIFLFLGSYAPLFAILGIRIAPSVASYILWGIALLSIIFTIVFFNWIAKIPPTQIKVQELHTQSEVLGFIVTYIIPFVTFNVNTWQDWTSLALLLAVIAILYVNSSLVYVNPVLAIFGWHMYTIVVKSTKEDKTNQGVLITRKVYDSAPFNEIKVVALGEVFSLEVK